MGHVHCHLWSRFPAIQNFEDACWRPGLSQKDLQFAPDGRIVVLKSRVFFDTSVFDGLKEIIEADVAVALEEVEALLRYVTEELGVLAPWGDVFEDPVPMRDEDFAVV